MYHLLTVIFANAAFWGVLTIFGAAAITSFTPKCVYVSSNVIFKIRPFEISFYKVLKIHKWKDKLPIYRYNSSMFNRKYLVKEMTAQYFETFIIETCKAEFVHLLIIIFGFSSIVFVFLIIEPLRVFVFVYLFMICIHMPFIITQRYNRQRLIKVLQRMS